MPRLLSSLQSRAPVLAGIERPFSQFLWQSSPVDRPGRISRLEQVLFRNPVLRLQFLAKGYVAVFEVSDDGTPLCLMLELVVWQVRWQLRKVLGDP